MNSDITLRVAGTADHETILAINAAGSPGVWPIEASDLQTAVEQGTVITVAIDAGTIVGDMTTFTADDPYDAETFLWFRARCERFIYIDQIAVAPSARRRGVAARFYSALRTRASQMQAADGVWCSLVCDVNVDPPNPASLRFHVRQGFQVRDVIEPRQGFTVAVLEWRQEDFASPGICLRVVGITRQGRHFIARHCDARHRGGGASHYIL